MSRRKNRIRGNAGEDYVQHYPELKKWINQCVCCQARGYNPNMPKGVGGFFCTIQTGNYLRKTFRPLAVNEFGLCEICANISEKF